MNLYFNKGRSRGSLIRFRMRIYFGYTMGFIVGFITGK